MNTTPTPTTPPPTPMHGSFGAHAAKAHADAEDDVSTQLPIKSNDGTSQRPVAIAEVDDDDEIKIKAAELLKAVERRRERDLTLAFSVYAKEIKPMTLRCANAARSGDDRALEVASEEMRASLRLLHLKFKRILNENKQSQLYSQTLNNRKPVVIPKDLPFDIVGQTTTTTTSNLPPPSYRFYDVNSKLARRSNSKASASGGGDGQGSVFTTTPTTSIKQRKRKRRHDKKALVSPVKSKKARANPLWTAKEIKKVERYVYAYSPHVLALNPTVTPGQLAEKLSTSLSKGKHYRSPTAVVKKIRTLGLVLTNPKDAALRKYLIKNNLMQYVPKRFQSASPPSPTPTDDSHYTEEEIASVESKQPTTTGLASLIASIPVPVATST